MNLCPFVTLCLRPFKLMNILLHMCCSNCSLYPLRILKKEGHGILGYWYNPNIHPSDEYVLRLGSLQRLADEWKIDIIYNESRPAEYFSLFLPDAEDVTSENIASDPFSITVPPPPERCRSCYGLRLEKAARQASDEGFDGFTTTLLISPYQDFDEIVRTGRMLEEKYNVMFYEKDFRPHFREAMNLSKEMGLYRQKYCGCIYSRTERDSKVKSSESRV